MRIFVTNDDGINALGILRLEERLRLDHEILLCAPDREQSASSHSLSLSRPLRLLNRGENRWACDGTPTDSVLLAYNALYKENKPDLLISGINHGQNMGEDVTYSGTVAAAIEGSILGIPSIACSLITGAETLHLETTLKHCAGFIARFVEIMPSLNIAPQTFLNINFPNSNGEPYQKYQFTRLGRRVFNDIVIEKTDPRGQPYYWIAGEPDWTEIEGTDYSVTKQGIVSISPLRVNFDDAEALKKLGNEVMNIV